MVRMLLYFDFFRRVFCVLFYDGGNDAYEGIVETIRKEINFFLRYIKVFFMPCGKKPRNIIR